MAQPKSGAVWQAANDELAIRNLVARLAQAADDRDEDAYRLCLARTVTTTAESGAGVRVPAGDYVRASMARLAHAEWTHHKLANAIIQIDPGRVYASAWIDVVVDLACPDAEGTRRRVTMGGRYDLGFVYLDDGWLIDKRIVRWRYTDGEFEGLSPLQA